MLTGIIGTKIDQSQTFDEVGNRIPITRFNVSDVVVVAVKTQANDGYDAVVLGVGLRRAKTLTRGKLGTIKKAGLEAHPPRFLKEIKTSFDDGSLLTPGVAVKAQDVFKPKDIVDVTGTSKGKGFAGVVKRHHFKGGPRTHGQSDRERAPGSIGQTTTPGRVYKGKRMAGRMGSDTVTVANLQVIAIDESLGIVTIKGLVPGGKNTLVVIKKQVS